MSGERFGDMFKRLRIEGGYTLRAFSLKLKADPGNISRLERGKMPPPESPEILAEYARSLGLPEGSEEWIAFHDLAAAEKGRIPQDLLEDSELVDQLPVLFRVLRKANKEGDPLSELIEKIRRA